MIHAFELDENLFPHRKLTASSGPYPISGTFLHVRSPGEWTLKLRGCGSGVPHLGQRIGHDGPGETHDGNVQAM